MSVHKIKKGPYYYADFYDFNGVRRRLSLQTENKQVALLKYQELIRRRNAVKERMPVHITWDAFKAKLLYHMSIDKARNTCNRMKLAIRYLEEMKKPRFLQDITPELLQTYKEHLIKKNISARHINSLVICIKTAMHRGEKWQYVPKRDWTTVTKIKTARGRVVFHTPEEIDKLLAACPSEAWKIVVLLGADAGLRRGEMANLKWEDVDFDNNQLYIAPNKTENHRFVPMTQDLRNALEKAHKRAKHEYVVTVCQPMKGNRCNPDYLTTFYQEVAKAAGVDSFLHKLRHTFASLLVQNGVELYTVSKLLGHSSIQMTEIYAHLAPRTLHKAVMNLPKRGMTLARVEEKTVCESNKACKQVGLDFGDLVGK